MLQKRSIKLLIILLIAAVAAPFIFIGSKLNSLEKEVVSYLIEQKGYATEDIVQTETSFGKLPSYSVWVTFANEPQFKYQYMKNTNEITQLSFTVTNIGRNSGIDVYSYDESTLKHLE